MDVKEIQKQLGLRLRELRIVKKMRQEDLEKWNFPYRYYGMIERGSVNPSLDTLIRLCKIFEINLHELFRFMEIDGITSEERESIAIKVSKNTKG